MTTSWLCWEGTTSPSLSVPAHKVSSRSQMTTLIFSTACDSFNALFLEVHGIVVDEERVGGAQFHIVEEL